MTTPRESILHHIRTALAQGNRAGGTPPLPARGSVGYQGAGGDPASIFCQQLTAAGGIPHVVAGEEAAIKKVLELLAHRTARRVLLGRGTYLDPLRLAARLQAAGADVIRADEVKPSERNVLFTADLGISGVAYLIAETGSIVVAAGPNEPRSLTLLPPVHIAVATAAQIVPDLFDLFAATAPEHEEAELPSCLTLITGPSKTGDIELKLVTGVHGPGEVHVVLMR